MTFAAAIPQAVRLRSRSLEVMCDAAIVKMPMIRHQGYLGQGLSPDEAVELMRSQFVPEARLWRQKQILKFDLMHRPPPTDAVN